MDNKINLEDSVDKIVTRYFASITNETFSYKGKTYEPKAIYVSPLLLRGYTCPENCGACCRTFTIDYLPDEVHPANMVPREIEFNGKKLTIFSDLQKEVTRHHCKYLDIENNGRCTIHPIRPFSCDFELIRTLEFPGDEPNKILQRVFGRGWHMLRCDGQTRGALCKMTPATKESVDDVIRKFKRLEQWCDYFGLKETKIPEILEYIEDVRSFVPRWKVAPRIIQSKETKK